MEDIKKKLRKVQDTLVITGTGVCAFGIWGVISTVMYLIMNKNELADLIEKKDLQHFIPVFYAILFIAVAAIYAVYLFVGLSARSEGLKKKSRYVYLFFAFWHRFLSCYKSFSVNFKRTGKLNAVEFLVEFFRSFKNGVLAYLVGIEDV